VLGLRRKVSGEGHPDTSLSAWNLLEVLLYAKDYQRAMNVLEKNFLWLLGRDPSSLSAVQREMRNYVSQKINDLLKEQNRKEGEKGP